MFKSTESHRKSLNLASNENFAFVALPSKVKLLFTKKHNDEAKAEHAKPPPPRPKVSVFAHPLHDDEASFASHTPFGGGARSQTPFWSSLLKRRCTIYPSIHRRWLVGGFLRDWICFFRLFGSPFLSIARSDEPRVKVKLQSATDSQRRKVKPRQCNPLPFLLSSGCIHPNAVI